jgi:DNA polymerase-1
MLAPKSDTLFLIDANSLIHRAFHALPPLTSPQGEPVQALYGVASILLKLWREEHPRYAAACFDRPEPTFREKRYAAYKAQRPAAPAELVAQIIEARRLFEAFHIPTFEVAGWEADDLIATLARRLRGTSGGHVVILTGDLDALQLVEDRRIVVRALKTGLSDTVLYDEAAVIARYGLTPRELPDYKALVGDVSDNVKGVPGIGPKTAVALIARFGTLEALLAAAPQDERLAKKLLPHRAAAVLAKELVTLRDDAPVVVKALEELAASLEMNAARAYFEKLGFRALLKRLDELAPVADSSRLL